ncbi:56_t:CDS:2 [Diversispora eburnea]|uniref:56_t:CDS:1 n=1 Tax=Diversispora eburnea TaxID=1213867 RepID=A0A9N9GB10_9GLOM|nr:56_t:CDS:2 [Diversispora eburnea]
MGALKHCIAITFAILCLLILLGTFAIVDYQNVPEQDISKNTGYPIWHPPVDGINGSRGNDETFVAITLFSTILMFLCGYFIMKWTCNVNNNYKNKRKTTFFVLNGDKTVPTFEFDVTLGVYCLVTACASLTVLWTEIGKVWVSIGLLHNAVEFMILVNMHYGGRITSSKFYGMLSLYVLISAGLTFFLTWPYDAAWFRMQGLTTDWALLIQFTRTYFNTKKHIKNDYSLNPLIGDNDDDERGERSDVVYNPDNGVVVHLPYQILILIVASGFHIFGNCLATIFIEETRMFEMFAFSYAIAYSAYAYFVYLDTQAITVLPQKVIHLPDTIHWKIVLVTIFSLTFSLLIIRLGLANTG